MKRINLSVDFEDNKLFDKSLRDSLKAEMKTLIRNNYFDMLKSVIEPECERLITRNVTIDAVRELAGFKINSAVHQAIDDLDVDDIILSKIEDVLDYKIQKYLSDIDDKINSIIKEVITQKVADGLNNILNK